ncbi:SDR family oxidoreductase [Luteolibacter yonseiensis]|uniref:SDR family oxidoreductase n=1 Tax=Luteolibacter yonseiensis TaxID=1144680 RepID=A0A934R6D5_9BACT|nr:SDR family oxidoreductase [Luteolibacter yonseiensis]MBK1817812.1 SDR family oxidoreductase [Luteolibacter yonseiensis]
MSTRPTLFVTGASGHLGRKTVEFLLASGKGNIIAGSRDPEKIADLVAKGAEARAVDFNRSETLATAFAGVDRLLLVSTDAIDQPGRRLIQHTAAIQAAIDAGVKHIIYTSATNASPDSASIALRDHHETEQAVISSGLGHTILRNTLYMDNLLMSLPQILSSGQWFHAAAGGKIAMATREDCARAAAAALESDFSGNRIIEISGAELLDHDETASIISGLSGKPVSAIATDEATLTHALLNAGLPDIFARLLATFDTAQAKGEFNVLTSAVRDLTGKQPTTLSDFLKDHV